ncbi:Prefoldin subunit [Carpediemonas membranifera]|uniref:Prefoldin subunit n=1 Tax=Carpediemonas membranifera TaxID=201153 RepID=A0A8J6DXM7_9EUKA|nr:Prefoldin subunit [Carpediemonas membranifera]KAG9390519.1 Prefoldin subunit [Carpediemonas membranifera]|eukprot:KAG9390467.1 Prefoldin subunit [Carpediemonas membranifera]
MNSSVLTREDESNAEVTRADQEKINLFSRLNTRLSGLKERSERLEADIDSIEQSEMVVEEMMVMDQDHVLLNVGTALVMADEDVASTYVSTEKDSLKAKHAEVVAEINKAEGEMSALKQELYGKFGSSINLDP